MCMHANDQQLSIRWQPEIPTLEHIHYFCCPPPFLRTSDIQEEMSVW